MAGDSSTAGKQPEPPDSEPAISARVIAQGIERLGEANLQRCMVICRYICIGAAIAHALAPYFHSQVFGCLEESELRCNPDEQRRDHALIGVTHSVDQNDGAEHCVIVTTLSCSPTELDTWAHALSSVASYGIFYSIAIRMARAFAQYRMRYELMTYFSELTPWPTMKTDQRCPHFGLVCSYCFLSPSVPIL
jgi:hypothetical protein